MGIQLVNATCQTSSPMAGRNHSAYIAVVLCDCSVVARWWHWSSPIAVRGLVDSAIACRFVHLAFPC